MCLLDCSDFFFFCIDNIQPFEGRGTRTLFFGFCCLYPIPHRTLFNRKGLVNDQAEDEKGVCRVKRVGPSPGQAGSGRRK